MARARANGCDCAVMEVSSHALHQGRTAGLDFRAGVFTNLASD
ncbi:MAG: Mur ligase family protein, partial [Planctomycetia bacterium]